MTQEEILDRYFKNMGCNEASNVNEAVMNYDPKDEALTCKNLRNDGTCYKGTFCKFRHTPLTSILNFCINMFYINTTINFTFRWIYNGQRTGFC